MKVFATLLLCSFASIACADIVFLKGGQQISGAIKGLDSGSIVLSPIINGEESGTIKFKLNRVEKIKFELLEEEEAILKSRDISKLSAYDKIWEFKKAFLGIQGNDALKVGVSYAKLLLSTDDIDSAEKAIAIYDLILQESWDKSKTDSITTQRIAALAKAGKMDQALAEYKKIEDKSDNVGFQRKEVFEQIVESKFLEADLAWTEVLKLEKEWPKWHLMPEIRSKRMRLLHEALDKFHEPVSNYGELEKQAAEGLLRSAQIYKHIGDNKTAIRTANMILAVYPSPFHVEGAKRLIKKVQSDDALSQ
ncbi:MAG: hypothetical protein AAGA18_13760 [Verrucomicrobiota bacterium]